MPRNRLVSPRQLEILIAFAEANRDIALGRCSRGPQGHQLSQQAWETVAIKLNAVADGVTRKGDQWRRYWIETKAKTKAKAADNRRSVSATGGGPNKIQPLTEFENRILGIIGNVAVEGLRGVQIPFNVPNSSHSDPENNNLMEEEWLEVEESSPAMSSGNIEGQPLSPLHPETMPSLPSPASVQSEAIQAHNHPQTELNKRRQRLTMTQQTEQSPVPIAEVVGNRSAQASPDLHSVPSVSAQVNERPQAEQRQRQRRFTVQDRNIPDWARAIEERRMELADRNISALENLNQILANGFGQINEELRNINNNITNVLNYLRTYKE